MEHTPNTNKIAKIIHHWASDNPLLIGALADYFEAEPCVGPNCQNGFVYHHTTDQQWSEPCGYCQGSGLKKFDLPNFIRIATGVDN